ncbi:MAG: hypothetical protein HY235_02090 [Acidobacteria bacterium]|nr:hypothetical protein [Acidobacteriota bacterium]
MAEDTPQHATSGARSDDEVALEMMKFIALTTGFGKPSTSSAGFGGKAAKTGSEEYADALLELFERCRKVIRNGKQ